MFTENTTAEAAYHNGKSYSSELFDFFIRLSKFELYHGIKFHLIHVAGTRMIEQGTDGLSCGNKWEGVLSGVKILILPLYTREHYSLNLCLLIGFVLWRPTLS